MVQQGDNMGTPDSLSLRSKSPRSLQARNTKNLSLDIKDNKITVGELSNSNEVIPNIRTKPIFIDQRSSRSGIKTQEPHSFPTQRTEASIYSLPFGKQCSPASPVCNTSIYRNTDSSSCWPNKSGRVHSLSLSLKTKELVPNSLARGRSQTLSSALETSTPQVSHFDGDSKRKTWVSPEDIKDQRENSDSSDEIVYSEAYKDNAYPNGPLLVIPPYVYLYSEPRLTEILGFDVVINVAKEIENLKPLIPKSKTIEYHHIHWGHNSKISSDLNRLTDLIHMAAVEGKRVLVHCQCGVSRSASLIVAYIMRFYKMGLNDAYSHLKAVATEISPNMGLIFQLMEWHELSALAEQKPRQPPEKTDRQLHEVDTTFGMRIPSSTSLNDLTIGSPEMTPRTPGNYFKNSASSSSSSASTSSSTIIGNQSNLKPIEVCSDLENFSPTTTDNPVATTKDPVLELRCQYSQ